MKKSFQRALSLQSLERREVFSVTVTEVEPNDRERLATAFVAPADGQVTLTGTSSSHNDKDFFTFQATATGPATVQVQTVNGRRVQLEWENAVGRELLETHPKNGINSGSVNLVAGERYFIRLRSSEKSAASYTVQILLTPGEPTPPGGTPTPTTTLAESEPNNRKSQADVVDLDVGNSLRLTGQTHKDDNDFFVFTPETSGRLQIEVASTTSQRIKFEIEDQIGQDIFETEPNDGVHGGTINVTAGTRYFLRVRGDERSLTGYNVDLAFAALANS